MRADLRVLGSAPAPGTAAVELSGPSGTFRQALDATAGEGLLSLEGSLRVPDAERWWPHTHGEPALHAVRLLLGDEPAVEARPAGFRQLEAVPPGGSAERDGIALRVNDVPVFARGAVWTPADPVGLAADAATVRAVLERVRDAGMNMLRVCGLCTYEDAVFHDLCDELGILVWQDLMFANFDYPYEDPAFREQVDLELDAVLGDLAGRPSLAVVCGNSEVEQQVAMLGLDPAHRPPAAVRRGGAGRRRARRTRCRPRPLLPVRRRPAVPPGHGDRQLLRRRRLPPAAHRRAALRRPVRRRVPRLLERARRTR